MKLFQLRNRKESSILSAELSTYGLRPEDWILKPEKNDIYRIENRTEPDFFFCGTTKVTRGKRQWQSITLKSV